MSASWRGCWLSWFFASELQRLWKMNQSFNSSCCESWCWHCSGARLGCSDWRRRSSSNDLRCTMGSEGSVIRGRAQSECKCPRLLRNCHFSWDLGWMRQHDSLLSQGVALSRSLFLWLGSRRLRRMARSFICKELQNCAHSLCWQLHSCQLRSSDDLHLPQQLSILVVLFYAHDLLKFVVSDCLFWALRWISWATKAN